MQTNNDFNKPGYGGPCPPKADKSHTYHFRFAAFSSILTSPAPSATCVEIITVAEPYRIEFTELVGFYCRRILVRRPSSIKCGA
jgi:phosphatidylethanolamine-binding protein (PEBP) family uncharacterized protein